MQIGHFLGITLAFCQEYGSPPHLHVNYNQYQGVIGVENINVNGNLPPRVAALACEWVMKNKQALVQSWEMHKQGYQDLPHIPQLVE
ncbi:MAG: DUF4160 domain-containing protein [Alphaproteobacteria bacterium]|nr:DUF4160 domain-containing protein [Alphaproteobacteria bacterium]